MMKTFSLSAALALALAGAACASPSQDADQTPPDAPVVEASASEDDGFGGFNLMVPGDDLETAEDGWNLGVNEDVTEDGFVIPDGMVEDRLGDVAELPTGEDGAPEISADLPAVDAPEDDLIRIE